jgi:hypothetical protein
MAMPWFRLYHEWDSDPKVQIMPEVMQRRLVMLFCARCKCDGEVTFREVETAFHWRVSLVELAETKALFIKQGFIDEHWNLVNWNRRQFLSDSSTSRTRRYREQKRTSQQRHGDGIATNAPVTVTVPDTDADTEQTQKRVATKKAAKDKPSQFVLPEWISNDVWKDFEEMRRKKRAPLTDRARWNIVTKLVRLEKEGQRAEDILNQSITNAWQDVFPLRDENRGGIRPNEAANGACKPSPAKQRVEANRAALAAAIKRRGLDGTGGAGRADSETLSESGFVGLDGGLSTGLRASGPEILPPAIPGRAGGLEDQAWTGFLSTTR